MKNTLGLMGIGTLALVLAGCPDSAPTDADEKDQQANSGLADQCKSAAQQSPDGEAIGTHNTLSNNVNERTPGEPFDLKVSLQGQGNAFIQLNCTVDAEGKVSYQGFEKSETQAGQ
ncbi:hypothetical protein [Phytohalomonas tamaricis]|uniref:hypothetical protein n=1 Tax=Phytohalomonas tamaricis TaxID=2081032 RepID=UPI00131A48CB|nr:hypothetical protein [Phytohalomonas tamaricis]